MLNLTLRSRYNTFSMEYSHNIPWGVTKIPLYVNHYNKTLGKSIWHYRRKYDIHLHALIDRMARLSTYVIYQFMKQSPLSNAECSCSYYTAYIDYHFNTILELIRGCPTTEQKNSKVTKNTDIGIYR